MFYKNFMKVKWEILVFPDECAGFYSMINAIKTGNDKTFIRMFKNLCLHFEFDLKELCLKFGIDINTFNLSPKTVEADMNCFYAMKEFSDKTKSQLIGYDYVKNKLNIQVCANFFIKNAHIYRTKDDVVYIYNYSSGLYEEFTDTLFGKIFTSVIERVSDNYSIWNSHKENEVYKYICRIAQIYENEDEEAIYLIPVQNGIVNLRTMQLESFDEKYFFTSKSPVKYDSNAECNRFKDAMMETCTQDKEKYDLLQEWFGVGFIRNALPGKILFMFGDGASGKSTVADLISMLYSKTSNLTLANISQRFELVNMLGSEINIGHENSNVATDFDPNVFKIIATGDPITLAVKHQKGIQTRITTKCMFLFNNILEIGSMDSSMGFWRRICVIEFTNSFLNSGKKDLAKELMENEGSGILRFALEGAKRLLDNHYEFSECKSSKQALLRYKQSQNPLRAFLDDVIKVDKDSKVSRRQIKNYFIDYCEKECISTNGFERPQVIWKEFERWSKDKYDQPFKPYKTRNERGYYGISLKGVMNNVRIK